MQSIVLGSLGALLLLFGIAAALRPETAIELQLSHGPGLFADQDDDFIDDMVAATPWVGAILAACGAAVLGYVLVIG